MTDQTDVPSPAAALRPTDRRRPWLGVMLLVVLSPWIGEFLLGNIPATYLPAIVFLVPLYGFGALLVRETARGLGGGYPTILCFGAAYGVIEAGLFDQSLFNPGFGDLAMLRTTPIPGLGVSAYNALAFVVGHAVWSISLPIAIAERFAARDAPADPWLPAWALAPVAAVYLIGGYLIFEDVRVSEQFMASAAQMSGALAVAAAFVAFGLGLRRTRRVGRGAVPRPVLVGTIAFAVAATFAVAPETWGGVALKVAILALGGWLALTYAGRDGWRPAHGFAVIAALTAVYALLGFALTLLLHQGQAAILAGNAAFAAAAALLLAALWRRTPARG